MDDKSNEKPANGDRYVCDSCAFEVLVIEPCPCNNGSPFLSCCGEAMQHESSES